MSSRGGKLKHTNLPADIGCNIEGFLQELMSLSHLVDEGGVGGASFIMHNPAPNDKLPAAFLEEFPELGARRVRCSSVCPPFFKEVPVGVRTEGQVGTDCST